MNIPYFYLWVLGVCGAFSMLVVFVRAVATTPAVNDNGGAKLFAAILLFACLTAMIAPYFWALLNVGPK
jgi:hypothetical protein